LADNISPFHKKAIKRVEAVILVFTGASFYRE
jgi:hypothetical protein